MFKKFCIKAFQAVNLTIGATSLVSIAVGTLVVFGGAGLFSLEKAGVKTIPEKRIQQTLYLGMGSIFLGTVGFVSATFAAACVGSIVNDADLEEDSLVSGDTISSVFKPSSSMFIENNDDLLYLYKILRFEGCSQFENKLIVGRIEETPSRKTFIYDLLHSHQKDSLIEIFDVDFDEDKLIGKAFSSTKSNPWDAISEFVDFYRPQLEFKSS